MTAAQNVAKFLLHLVLGLQSQTCTMGSGSSAGDYVWPQLAKLKIKRILPLTFTKIKNFSWLLGLSGC